VVLRPATAADAGLLLAWANDPVTRAAGFHPEAIAIDEHERWLAARLASPATRLWIGEEDGRAVGQVRLERDEGGIAEIGISVAPEARGRGVARRLLATAIETGRADAAFGLTGFLARVRPDNAASLALFRGAGFAETGREVVNGLPCVVFRLG